MARLIQSIFSGGKSGFDDEELARYQAALQRGLKTTAAGGNPVAAATGGLLGQLVRSKFFPTEGEKADKAIKEESVKLAQVLDPAQYKEEYNMELANVLMQRGRDENSAKLFQAGLKIIDSTEKSIRDKEQTRIQQESATQELLAKRKANIKADLEYGKLVDERSKQIRIDANGNLGFLTPNTDRSKDFLNAEANEFRKYTQTQYESIGKLKYLTGLATPVDEGGDAFTGAGDYIITSSLVKAIDDGVMTDNEAKAAAGSAGAWENLNNIIRSFKEGDTLPAKARLEIFDVLSTVTKQKDINFRNFYNFTANKITSAYNMDDPLSAQAVPNLIKRTLGNIDDLYGQGGAEQFFEIETGEVKAARAKYKAEYLKQKGQEDEDEDNKNNNNNSITNAIISGANWLNSLGVGR
jgi:hypothetical protein